MSECYCIYELFGQLQKAKKKCKFRFVSWFTMIMPVSLIKIKNDSILLKCVLESQFTVSVVFVGMEVTREEVKVKFTIWDDFLG